MMEKSDGAKASDDEFDTERPLESLKAITHMSDEEVRQELNDLLSIKGLDNERRVMLYLARRYFVLGANCYQALKLHDGRDSVEECMQEGGDYLFYTAKKVLESE